MNEQSMVKTLCHGRVITTRDDEARVWDHKADDAAFQVWSDHDPEKWDKAADECVDYLHKQLRPVWKENQRFVEIGCGVGRLTHRLASKENAPHFIGMDISARMIDLATEREQTNETFIVNDGRTIKEIDQADAVYSMLTFQHIPRTAFFDYLKEIGRVLKPGGMFCFQYVEGDSEKRIAHETPRYDVIDCLCWHGLKATVANHGFMNDKWTWITGVKRG